MAPRSSQKVDDLSVEGSGNNTSKATIKKESGAPRVHPVTGLPVFPVEKPTFTYNDITQAIPKHLFKRSALKSLRYVAQDAAMCYGLYWLASSFLNEQYVPAMWMRALLWPVFWYALGTVMTGIWVLAHECGHQSFSEQQWVNDLVGMVLHSFTLVPYFSWKYSHANHHSNTNSCENDEVFVPRTRSQLKASASMSVGETFNDTPIANALGVLSILLFGWPFYLTFNSTGPAKYEGKKHMSHFHPNSALFNDPQRFWVGVSDVGFFAMLGVVGYWIYAYGFAATFFYYLAPLLVVNAHLVLITFLQHTDTYIPHFTAESFTFLRGALCTVDRSYGWLYDRLLHRIVDTHVCHHLYSKMPFYHAEEATKYIRQVVGPYYMQDLTPIPQAAMRAWSQCRFLEDGEDIAFPKNAQDWVEGEKRLLAQQQQGNNKQEDGSNSNSSGGARKRAANKSA